MFKLDFKNHLIALFKNRIEDIQNQKIEWTVSNQNDEYILLDDALEAIEDLDHLDSVYNEYKSVKVHVMDYANFLNDIQDKALFKSLASKLKNSGNLK